MSSNIKIIRDGNLILIFNSYIYKNITMKKVLLSMLFVTFFVACDKNAEAPILENQPDLTEIRIKENPGETLEYVGKIGSDFDSALDSLRNLKNIFLEIIKQPLEVLFDYDNRQFYGIAYGDCGVYADVLDTKGYYYLRTWYCPDENDADIQEESVGKIVGYLKCKCYDTEKDSIFSGIFIITEASDSLLTFSIPFSFFDLDINQLKSGVYNIIEGDSVSFSYKNPEASEIKYDFLCPQNAMYQGFYYPIENFSQIIITRINKISDH